MDSDKLRTFVAEILRQAVKKKKALSEKKGIAELAILLLLNTYSFADSETYKSRIEKIQERDMFCAIFVIQQNGSGCMVHSNEPAWLYGSGVNALPDTAQSGRLKFSSIFKYFLRKRAYMSKQNVSNLLYFECLSMRELYDCLKSWQDKNGEVFLSLEIQPDGDNFCCIAVINRVEVQESNSKMLSLSADEIKDLALWYSKAKSWHRKGKDAAVDWENKHLREEVAALIRLKLAVAKNELDIIYAFDLRNVKLASDDEV
jgi:hypothetical protein